MAEVRKRRSKYNLKFDEVIHIFHVSVFNYEQENEIPIQSASTSTLLTDFSSELGIDTPRRYISDEISSWHIQLNFPETYCVEKILSKKGNAETHRWECSEDACGVIPCFGSSCDDIQVSVFKADGGDIPDNCGTSVKLMIPQTDGKLLDFDYHEITEIVVTGYLFEVEPTPTTMDFLDPENLVVKCPELGEDVVLISYLDR